MKKEINIFYGSIKIENKYASHLGNSILSLQLKKGNVLISYPFNIFNDEDSENKIEPLEYQSIPLEIKSIEYSFIDSWNGLVRTVIDITVDKRKYKD